MPECTPQKDKPAFPRQGFQGPAHAQISCWNSVWISTRVSKITFRVIAVLAMVWHGFGIFRSQFHFGAKGGVPAIGSGCAPTGVLTFTRETKPLPGRPDFRGEGVRIERRSGIDLRALFLHPLGRPAGLVRNRSGNGNAGIFHCLPSTGSARGSHARTSAQDCQG